MQRLKVEFWSALLVLVSLLALSFGSRAQVIFADDFNSGASASWMNESGGWKAGGGVYYPQSWWPRVSSSLPFVLTNFVVEFDIHGVADGGIWLRKDETGQNGVLLVTGGAGWGWGSRIGDAGRALYWHVVTDGNYSPYLGEVFNLFTPTASDAHLRVVVSNSTYSVYLNGGATPISSITDAFVGSGRVGLYSFSGQTFDNFLLSVTPSVLDDRATTAKRPQIAAFTTSGVDLSSPSGQSTEDSVLAAIQPYLDLHVGTVLSWPAESTGYILEQSTNLLSPNWVAVPNPVREVNQVVLPGPVGNAYFRLRKP